MEGEITKLTMREAEAEMAEFRKIFTVVRLLKKKEIAGICGKENLPEKSCPCYSFWAKDEPCENCVSAKACIEKRDVAKLEFSDKNVYHVISRYVEVDGEPCVMECLRVFDEESLMDYSGGDRLLSHMNGYYEKMYTDAMTGIFNRRFYEEKLKNSTLAAGVAMIDLDDFKVYNDVYGHSAGDSVLTVVAAEMQKGLRTSDRLIRYGGDEFLLVMPGVREDGFELGLKNLLKNVNRIVLPGYAEIKLTTSIGATMCRNETVESAVNRADRLLYRAKGEKNVIVTDRDAELKEEKNKANILIVDDSEINREILTTILKNEFNVIEASGGKECVSCLKRYGTAISVILLDIMMPEMNGFDVLEYMTMNHYIEDIPVITITGDESEQTIRKAYEMGVSDFISRPFDAKVVYRRVLNTINLYEKQRRLISAVSGEILEKEKNSRILVDILSEVAEFRTGFGGRHVTNINKITELLLVRLMMKTKKYNLSGGDVYLITTASSLHDIGKVGIGGNILSKPGKLTPEEFEIVKTHTRIGAEMVAVIPEYQDEPLVKYAYQICLYHHEKYDGKGYPEGLKGDDIPIAAQVVSLADAYDALTAKRSYKEAYTEDQAIEMIVNGECGQFNPLLVECLLDVRKYLAKDKNGEIR